MVNVFFPCFSSSSYCRLSVAVAAIVATVAVGVASADDFNSCGSGKPICLRGDKLRYTSFERRGCSFYKNVFQCTGIGKKCCFWDGKTFTDGTCRGQRALCKSFKADCFFGDTCCKGQTGCYYFHDPPCNRDTFHKAIEPVTLDFFTEKEFTCDSTDNADVWCRKARPSRDGLARFDFFRLITKPENKIFYSCTMKINNNECKSCTWISRKVGSRPVYDCSNLIVKDIPDKDCNNKPGYRCVGRNSKNKCICKPVPCTSKIGSKLSTCTTSKSCCGKNKCWLFNSKGKKIKQGHCVTSKDFVKKQKKRNGSNTTPGKGKGKGIPCTRRKVGSTCTSSKPCCGNNGKNKCWLYNKNGKKVRSGKCITNKVFQQRKKNLNNKK